MPDGEDKPGDMEKTEERVRKKVEEKEKTVEEKSEDRVARKKKREKEENEGEKKKKIKPSPKKPAPSPPTRSTAEQSQKNLYLFTKSLNCKKEAKKEEDEYLKLRKQQLLADFLPKSKAAKMPRSEEKFPCSALKEMEKWNFGAIKAKYMALRPNGKYANWFGKSHDEKHKHEKCITIKDRLLLYRQRKEDRKASNKAQKDQPREIPRAPQTASQAGDELQKSGHVGPDVDGFDEEEAMLNVRYSSALTEKGVPFWLEEVDQAETEEEEAIVTKEAVQKDGQEAVNKKKEAPVRDDFDPTAPVKDLAKFDKIFDLHEVYLLTINNVVEIWKEEPAETPTESAEPRKINWNAKMNYVEYEKDLEKIVHKRGMTSHTKELKDVVKAADKD